MFLTRSLAVRVICQNPIKLLVYISHFSLCLSLSLFVCLSVSVCLSICLSFSLSYYYLTTCCYLSHFQVNCIGEFCTGKLGFMIKMSSKPDKPWLPESPQQWWRLPLSLLYHYGIIHCLLVVGAQSLLLRQIEITIGWLRMMILYIVCGCGGLLVSGICFSGY